MAQDLSPFFDANDGLTVTGVFVTAGQSLQGYFDITEVDLDEATYDIETAQFICERTAWLSSTVGDILVVPEGSYTINKVMPDGTGLAVLTLLKGE